MSALWRVAVLGFIVGALAGGGVGFQLATQTRPPAPIAPKPPDEYGPVPGPTAAVERAVVFHAWWRRPLSTTDVIEIVRLAGDGWPATAMLIRKDAAFDNRPVTESEVAAPAGSLWLRFDGDHRPTRAEVLDALRAALDRAANEPR